MNFIEDRINDPIFLLEHALIMIEDNKERENVKELYEDAIFLIEQSVKILRENETRGKTKASNRKSQKV